MSPHENNIITSSNENFGKLYSFIISKLEKELPSYLTYHNVQHTKDVVAAVQHISDTEKISEEEKELLLVAALFHDVGFTKGYDDHESISCSIAKGILPSYNFNHLQIARIFGCITLLGLCLLLMPYPMITSDKLLISIFGGFFMGLGIGLIMRAGCALDGIEVLALYTFKKTPFTVTEIILAANIAIFSIAAIKLGIPTALYSILTYFTATRTIDFVVEGIEAYTGVTIISAKSELVKYRLVNELGRGITVYKGERGFLPGKFEVSTECDIIFTVVTRLELRKLKNLVHETDPKAFVFASTIKEASGGILRRRQMH